MLKKFIMEFVGTFLLLLCVASAGSPLMVGLTLAILVYIGGKVSGGHYNPAVTLALFFKGKICPFGTLGYITFQTAAALIAAILYTSATSTYFGPVIPKGVDLSTAMMYEMLGTFFLVATVLKVSCSKSFADCNMGPLVIGLSLAVGASLAGPFTGAVLNPAIALGALMGRWFNDLYVAPDYYVYFFAPFAASILAFGFGKLFCCGGSSCCETKKESSCS